MNKYKRSYLLVKELGLSQLLPYAIYKAQLRSGSLEKAVSAPCPTLADPKAALARAFLFQPVRPQDRSRENSIIQSADEIISGSYHPFSGAVADLHLTLHNIPLQHWTHYGDQIKGKDIKTIWEPARFSWVFPLCQAYQIHAEEKYARTFWHNLEVFLSANPENHSPNWSSAQEVALRLVPWLWAAQTFADSPESTPQRIEQLLQAIWQHCARISQTMNYSRSQNNNHLLSESLGLMIGGLVFNETSQGRHWLKLGAKEFQRGIINQVDSDGIYSQHSANYHRLMLHLALIFKTIAIKTGITSSQKFNQRLAQATRWMVAQMDAATGYLPNLGHNDGSNLLPLGCQDFRDYRPTAQAACRAFLGTSCLPTGEWDELADFLGFPPTDSALLQPEQIQIKSVHRIGNDQTWATMRSLQFHSRPAHADLLHVDLWHKGINLLADAGTYAYNLPDPWQNRLAGTAVHNTIVISDQDQMIRDSKFLWLERTGVFTLPTQPNCVAAILYCNLPIAYTQIRTMLFVPDFGFKFLDQIDLARLEKFDQTVTIQWLLPDWKYELKDDSLTLKHGKEHFTLVTKGSDPADQSVIPGTFSLIRAGETLVGKQTDPIRGWVSNTYLEKSPALSLAVTFETAKSLEIRTELIL